MREFYCFILALTFLAVDVVAETPPQWAHWARELSAEKEEDREKARTHLRSVKDLNGTLLSALDTPYRSLALDVVASLKTTDILPELLRQAPRDPDGFSILAINAMLSKETLPLIGKTYDRALRSRNSASQLSPATQVAMLDPLGRIGWKLPEATIRRLFQHPFSEVRLATLDYVRLMTLKHEDKRYDPLLPKVTRMSPYQLRLKAIHLVRELPATTVVNKKSVYRSCRADRHEVVRKYCKGFGVPEEKAI